MVARSTPSCRPRQFRDRRLDYLNGGSWEVVAEHTEIESGKNNDRPALVQAIEACRRHKATPVIARRLSRNLAFIAALMDSGVSFVAVDNPHANKLTVHIPPPLPSTNAR